MPNKEKLKRILIMGLVWGLMMFLIMEVMSPYADGEELKFDRTMLGLGLWLSAGLIFGWLMVAIQKPEKKE